MFFKELKEIFRNFLKNLKWFHFLIFIFIFLINIIMCLYTVILDRTDSIHPISINFETGDINNMQGIEVYLQSPADKIIKFKIGKNAYNWIWQGMLKKVYIGIPEDKIDLINNINVNIGKKEFVYKSEDFKSKWKRTDLSKIRDNVNFNPANIIFASPDDMRLTRSFIPSGKLRSTINYKGEYEILNKMIVRIVFITLFFSLLIYFLYYFTLKPYFKKNNGKLIDLLKQNNSFYIIAFIAFFILIFIFYVLLNFRNKILLYLFIVIPVFIFCYNLIMKTLNESGNNAMINPEKKRTDIFIIISLSLIVILGFILRIIGIDHGFPVILDSSVYSIVDSSRDMIKNMTLDTNFYMRPNHISIYINTIAYEASSLIAFHKPFAFTFDNNILFYHIVSMVINAIFGSAMAVIGYFIGKEFNKYLGLIIALYISIFSIYVNISHGIDPDQSLTCFVMLVILFAVKYLKDPSHKNFFFMLLFSVLSLLEKYPGIITIFLIIAVIAVKNHKNGEMLKKIITAGMLFCLILFIISPFFFIRIYSVIFEFLDEARTPLTRKTGYLSNLINYPKTYFYDSGIIMLVFLIIGLIMIVKNEKIKSMPLFFGFIYYLLLSKINLSELRWTIPMFVSPIIISCYGIYSIFRGKYNVKLKIPVMIIAFIFVVISFSSTFFKGLYYSLVYSLKDTRVVSMKYLKDNGIDKNEILNTGFDPVSPSVRNDEFFDLYNNPLYMTKIKYYIVTSFIYSNISGRKDIFKDEMRILDEIKTNELLAEYIPDKTYVTDHLFEHKNIISGIRYFFFYLKNKDNIYSGPGISIYKK